MAVDPLIETVIRQRSYFIYDAFLLLLPKNRFAELREKVLRELLKISSYLKGIISNFKGWINILDVDNQTKNYQKYSTLCQNSIMGYKGMVLIMWGWKNIYSFDLIKQQPGVVKVSSETIAVKSDEPQSILYRGCRDRENAG